MNAMTDAGEPISARLESQLVASLKSTGILTVTPDAPLSEVAGLMSRNRVHAVMVADDTLPEPPVVSDLDLVGALTSGHFDELCARDVAGTEAVTVIETQNLLEAAQLLSDHRVSHLIVRDGRRVPVGIVSTWDVARAIAEID
jgi:CBS domain-containing protein